jgi:hypothetical protein
MHGEFRMKFVDINLVVTDGLYSPPTVLISQRDVIDIDKTILEYFLSLYLTTLYQLQSYITLSSAMK